MYKVEGVNLRGIIMSTAIGLNGGYINRSISHSEIQNIKNARTLNDVSSTWGKIKDWFCGTHVEEAKKNLFFLFNDKVATKDKFVAFETLKDLSAEPYKENFIQCKHELLINSHDREPLFSLKKDIIAVDENAILSSIMEDTKDAEMCKTNFIKDFSRNFCHGVYSLNGNNVTSEEQLTQFTDSELTCIRAIANQRVFGTIIDEVIKSHSTLIDCPTDVMKVRYDITQLSNGKIKVTASCYKDVAFATEFEQIMEMIKENDQCKRTLSITATFEIDRENISTDSLELYSVN